MPWKESCDQLRQHIKKQRHYFANKGPSSQGYGFSSSHVWMWELDCKESWALKNCCFWTVVLEKTLERPLDCTEIKPDNPEGNQSWIFIGRTDAEAETPLFSLLDAKCRLIRRDPDVRKDWRQEEKKTTEDKMVVWHHQLNGHDLSKLWKMVRTGSLVCCNPWCRKCQTQLSDWITTNNSESITLLHDIKHCSKVQKSADKWQNGWNICHLSQTKRWVFNMLPSPMNWF